VIKIGKKDADEKDEWWCMFYKCPICSEINIAPWFNFCPMCGEGLFWDTDILE
jgi:hypothetical protein